MIGGSKNILTSGLFFPFHPPRLSDGNLSGCCSLGGARAVKIKFGVHLDVQLVCIGKDVNAFSNLSVQTLLEGPLNFDFKA